MYNIFFLLVLGYMDKFFRDMQGFADDRILDRTKDFRLWFIHDDTFGDREIVCTAFGKLREMGGLANKEEME